MIGFDPVLSYEYSGHNGIQIQADQDQLSESEKIAKAAFQKKFYSYVEHGILTFIKITPNFIKLIKLLKTAQLFNQVNLDLSLKLQGDQLTPDVHDVAAVLVTYLAVQASLLKWLIQLYKA